MGDTSLLWSPLLKTYHGLAIVQMIRDDYCNLFITTIGCKWNEAENSCI